MNKFASHFDQIRDLYRYYINRVLIVINEYKFDPSGGERASVLFVQMHCNTKCSIKSYSIEKYRVRDMHEHGGNKNPRTRGCANHEDVRASSR